jgi:hypothetical protein
MELCSIGCLVLAEQEIVNRCIRNPSSSDTWNSTTLNDTELLYGFLTFKKIVTTKQSDSIN